jgi:flagellar biosynthesis/type III secretory pathway M-ring protein FliF/YscJ
MDNPLMVAVIIIGVTLVAMLVVLFWLVHILLKLKHDYQVLNDSVHSNTNDIIGLCSAALMVDSRIATVDRQIVANDEQINNLLIKLAVAENNEQSTHAYSVDIRKVRSGASVNELMKNSGLSHDEAALLIRLHGSERLG